jgi:hypothetical protein
MKGVHSVVFIGLISASAAQAEWQEVSEAKNGSFYTNVESANIEANNLAIYFDPDSNCDAHATIFDWYSELDREGRSHWRNVSGAELQGTMQSKIDRSFSGESVAYKDYSYSDEDEFGTIQYTFELSPEYVIDLEKGAVVKFRFTEDGEHFEDIIRYPLEGSKLRLTQARNLCEEALNGSWSYDFESNGEVW